MALPIPISCSPGTPLAQESVLMEVAFPFPGLLQVLHLREVTWFPRLGVSRRQDLRTLGCLVPEAG